MKAATHRGNCQVCGHQQHVMEDGLAKHGYTVDYGYFSGTCRGSAKQPVQIDRAITDATIVGLGEYAVECDTSAARLKAGEVHPVRIHTGQKYDSTTYKYVQTYIDWKDGTAEQQTKAREIAIAGAESDARFARAHAVSLKQMADKLHGTALPLISDLEAKAAPAPKAVVDVKAAKVHGAFGSKAARKDALDTINRAYDRQIDALQAIFLAVPNDARTQEQTDVYYAPHNLCNWRPKHSAAALKVFPQAAGIVAEIEILVKAREAVRAAP